MHHKKRFSLVGKWGEVDLHHSLVESSELRPTTRKTKPHSSHKLSFLFMAIYNIAVPHVVFKIKGLNRGKELHINCWSDIHFFFGPTPVQTFERLKMDQQLTLSVITGQFKLLKSHFWICPDVLLSQNYTSVWIPTPLKSYCHWLETDHRSSAHSACAETS